MNFKPVLLFSENVGAGVEDITIPVMVIDNLSVFFVNVVKLVYKDQLRDDTLTSIDICIYTCAT